MYMKSHENIVSCTHTHIKSPPWQRRSLPLPRPWWPTRLELVWTVPTGWRWETAEKNMVADG